MKNIIYYFTGAGNSLAALLYESVSLRNIRALYIKQIEYLKYV
jgi:hypothetical protein